ncbi:hypothetical protein Tco_1313195 [Tanacetum coccineum]
MADENIPVPAPTRSDDQILPFTAWVPTRKSNHVLDLQKRQKNPIFQIAVDILQNTNFFRAFTASALVPAIYIQQFWNTLTYVEKTETYRFQLDEDWFTLDANLLREALEITPIDQTHPFVTPLLGDAIMDFVKELGYPHVSKTSRHDRPRYPVLQMLWGIITSTNVEFAELMWEEFVQAIQTFLTDKANLGSPTKKGRKDKPHQTNKNLDNITQNLGSRVYTLELRDLSYKNNEAVCESVKEAVQIALQAPLRDGFRDLSEELCERKLNPKGMSFSLKRISLPQAPQSSAWKKSDTRDASLSSSKQ